MLSKCPWWCSSGSACNVRPLGSSEQVTAKLGGRPCTSFRVSIALQAPGQALAAAEDSDSDADPDDLGGGSAMGGMYDAEEMEVSLEDEEALAAFMVGLSKTRILARQLRPPLNF